MALTAANVRVELGTFAVEIGHLAVDSGRAVALIGENGAGKTTVLRALQGLIPYRGSVVRDGRAAGVFAHAAVLRGSASWNVARIARSVVKAGAHEASTEAARLLGELGVAGEAQHVDARRLSTGQRQRLAIARALAVRPRILFLDEAFANIDAASRSDVRLVVRDYMRRSACAVVLATQSIADVTAFEAATVVIDAGRATASFAGPSELAGATHPYVRAILREAAGSAGRVGA